jgi:hypothetical protein
MLGADGARRYFVGFATPAEQRASVGVIGNFAVITATNGRLDLTRNGRNTDLNTLSPGRVLVGPPDYVRRYGEYQPQNFLQNVTLSPDFPSVAQVIEGLYPEAGGDSLDGVILLDPIAVDRLISLTGPIDVAPFGITLTPANAAGILLQQQYEMFPDLTTRSAFLETVVTDVFNVVKGSSGTLPGAAKIGSVMDPMIRQGHMKFQSAHHEEQSFFGRIDATGGFPKPLTSSGDVIGLVTQNAAGNKVDVFQHRTLDYNVRVDPSAGTAHATATVSIHNDSPPDGLPGEVIGSVLDPPPPLGTSRILFSVYTRLSLTGAAENGQSVSFVPDTEFGVHVYTAVVDIPAGGTDTVVLRFSGPAKLDRDHRYRLNVWHQTTVNPDHTTITVRGTSTWLVREH